MTTPTPQYTLTDDSVTIIWEGKPHTVRRGAANFESLRQAIFSRNWTVLPSLLTLEQVVAQWSDGDFRVNGNTVYYKGEALPKVLNDRILNMVSSGENHTPLLRFWEKLQANPSWRSVQQLYPFLQHKGIPIDDDGNVLAYKAVNRDYTDCYTGKVDNSVGAENEMPRNKISDDPNIGCHFGYHVGAIAYANSYGPSNRRIVICKVDPKDVVCIPKDSNYQKMRVSRYKVIGNYGGNMMSSTTVKSKDMDVSEPKPPKAPKKAAQPKKPAAKAPKKARTLSTEANPSLWESYDKMDLIALKDVPIGPLRTYASRHLKISGASKIPGGKIMLIQAILEVRQK